MAFEQFPYTDLHTLSLDWVMQQVGKLADIDYQGLLDHNIEIGTNNAHYDQDLDQTSSRGTLPAEIVSDVSNYYLDKAPVLAREDVNLQASQERQHFAILTADGKYLIPYANGNQMTSAGDPMGSLLCMTSFLNRGMSYGHTYGMFNTDPGQTSWRQLVCSDYVACGLRGIDLRNSRHGGCLKNYESQYKSRTWPHNESQMAPEPKDTLITREMAYIFASRQALWELDYNGYSNVQPGDVLFFAYFHANNEARYNYLSIHHCATVLDVDPFGHRITVLESGEPSQVYFDFCYTRYTDQMSTSASGAPDWDSATTYAAGDIVHYTDAFGLTRAWYSKQGNNTNHTPELHSNWWASLATGPSVDSLNISRANTVSYRHVYVARPAWPNVQCVPIISNTVTDQTVYPDPDPDGPQLGDYMSMHTFGYSTWGFKKGDICCLKFKSDMSQLDDGSYHPTQIRIAGRTSGGIYSTIWHSHTNATWHDVPNDRVIYFVVDDDYAAIHVMLNSNQAGTINTEMTMSIYRL